MNTATFTVAEIEKARENLGDDWFEFLNAPSLSMGLYRIAAGTSDQESHSIHQRDEIYVGVSGRGHLTADDEKYEVKTGSVIYVKAGIKHHFHDVAEDLSVLVFFAGGVNADQEEAE